MRRDLLPRTVPLLLSLLLACGGEGGVTEPTPAAPRAAPLVVFGIDGATRTIMDPLMAAGRLPNFAKLRDRGVYTHLATREPTISPIIWTSIATGRSEAAHGIHGFTAELPGTELVSRLRLPGARERLHLSLTGIAAPGLPSQHVNLDVSGERLGEMTLGKEPATLELDLPAEAGQESELTLTFEASARKPKSHVYTTSLLRIEATTDGGPATLLTPAAGSAFVLPALASHGGGTWIETGGNREIATVSSNMRRVKALWNILSERGRRVLVAGFWVTWPAEHVNGTMISSYTSARYGQSKKGSFLKEFPHQTWPEELATELAPVLDDAIRLGRERAEGAAARFSTTLKPRSEEALVARMGFVTSNPVPRKAKDPGEEAEGMIWIATSDTFYTLAAAKLLAEEVPDLTVVYQGEVDVVSHEWYELEKSLTEGVIAQAYERADASLGRILAAMGPAAESANVVVLSDHGFAYDDTGVFEHQRTHPPGVLLMAGPGIRKGALPIEPGILDIAPTLLSLLGLPTARDMEGRPLAEVLTATPPPPIDSYESAGPKGEELPIPSPIDDRVKDQLRALGYLE